MENIKRFEIKIESENVPVVLYRVAGIFLKKRINIESLTVIESDKKGIFRFNLSIQTTGEVIIRIMKQIQRIIEVISVDHHDNQVTNGKRGEAATVVKEIDVSAIKKIQLLANSNKEVISLAQGIPYYSTPSHIREFAKEAIEMNLVDKYTSGYGIEDLRVEITKKVKRDNHIEQSVENIIVTHGGIEALMAVFLTLLDVDDEIIILTPDYASHITQTMIARRGGRPVFVPLKETDKGWELEAGKIEAAITPRTKAILFCNPCNPTGKVYSYDELKQISSIAVKHNLFIITDEIYEYFIFGGKKHISIGSFPEIKDRVISVFGVSKSYCMTGWRIGYIVAEKHLISQIFKVHDSLVTCPAVVSQYAALEAIRSGNKDCLYFREEFERRMKMVIDELSMSDKITIVKPEGTYYAFPKIVKKVDDYKLALKIIKEAKTALVPGSAFGEGGENHLRISFGGDEKLLKEGLKRFINYLDKNF